MSWVVRGGTSTPGALIKGYQAHLGAPGLYGFSVQFAASETVEALARAGAFPHAHISYAQEDELASALRPLGYGMRLVHSPGRGFHHTFVVLYDETGAPLRALPHDAATALSDAFHHQANPHPAR